MQKHNVMQPPFVCFVVTKQVGFMWIILIGLHLAAQADVLPFSEWKDSSQVSVVVSPSVLKRIQQVGIQERSNIKRAIEIGNIFIKHRFNNDDQYDAEFDERWNEIVGSIMSMSGEEWGKVWAERWQTVSNIKIGGRDGYTELLTCPVVKLTEIKFKPNGISLVYQATLVGSNIELQSVQNTIDTTRAGQPYETRIEIGARGKITDVSTVEQVMAYEYHYVKKRMKRDADMDEKQAALLHDKSATIIKGVNLSALAKRRREVIKELDDAVIICK